MKKVLVFYDFFKPARHAGGIVASLDNLSALISEKTSLYFFVSAYDLGQKEMLSGVTPDQWIEFKKNIFVFYTSTKKVFSRQVNQQIGNIEPDIIYINGLFTKFVFVPLLLVKLHFRRTRVIIAPRGMVQKGALETRSLKKKIFLFFLKHTMLPFDVTWHATDQQEVVDIRGVFGNSAKVKLALDTPSQQLSPVKEENKKMNEVNLVYLSLITEKKNLLFLIEVLGQTSPQFQITLDVYGPIRDVAYWKRCELLAEKLPAHVHFAYRGTVNPVEVFEVLSIHHFFVLPSLGENFGHAIYESLIAGRPVIISENTPWQNLTAKHAGWSLPLELASFKKHIELAASMNESDFLMYCQGAREVAKDYISENDFLTQYENLFNG